MFELCVPASVIILDNPFYVELRFSVPLYMWGDLIFYSFV